MAAAHAIFGLLNSTPFSGRLDDQRLRALLHSMALGGLEPESPEDNGGQVGEPGRSRRRPRSTAVGSYTWLEHGAVAEIILDRPEALNALSSAMAVQLAAKCGELGGRPEVRAVVISSSNARAFCVGADLKERARFSDAELAAQRPLVRAAFDAVPRLRCP